LNVKYRKTIFSHADIIVYVDTSLKTAVKRILLRNTNKPESIDVETELANRLDDYHRRKQNTMDDIAIAIREHCSRYIKINNNRSLSLSKLISEIRKCEIEKRHIN